MTGQQLKNSILQWAIQGKLVPQIESEGTAEDLLKEIRAERIEKIKKGEIKLSKPEKGIKQSDIHDLEIPRSWTWCILSDVCRVFGRIGFRGYTKEDLVKEKNGAISLSPSNMKENGLTFDNCTYISWEKYEESPEIKIQEGDILIVKTGSSYGKTSLVEYLPWKSTINPQIAVIKDITINRKYLKYLLESPYCRNIYEMFVLGTSIPTFSQLNLLSLNIPLPPLSEQKRIVSKIEELMPLVEQYGKAQEQLDALNKELPEKLKKSVLQEAIMGKLVPQDPKEGTADELLAEIRKEKEKLVKEGKLKKKDLEVKPIEEDEVPFEIPEGWRWCRLNDLALDSADGPFGSNLKSEHYTTKKEVRIVQLSNIGDTGWKDTNQKYTTFEHLDTIKRSEVFPGDLIIAKMMPAGRTIVCPSDDTKYVLSSDAVRFNFHTILNKMYLLYAINSSVVRSQIYEDVQGITRVRTSLNKLRDYLLPLPPLAEQKRIVEKVEEVLTKIDYISNV